MSYDIEYKQDDSDTAGGDTIRCKWAFRSHGQNGNLC